MNVTTHCFTDASDSFYNLNEDSTSSSQNNDSSICGYANYHNNNNVVGNEMGNNRLITGGSSNMTGLSSCDGTGHSVQMQRFENSFHIQYEHQPVANVKANRGKYDDLVVDNGYRKSYGLYDENQTFLNNGSEQALTVLTEKLHQQSNGSDLLYQQQFMEPCFNYPSNDVDSNVTYKIALDSGQ